MDPQQSYENHKRFVPGYHYLLWAVLGIALAGSLFHLWRTLHWGTFRVEAATLTLVVIGLALVAWYTRVFALKAQDRAIRAEEALRCYLLTGKPLDPRLRIGQVIALRFASDEEYPELMQRAAEENLRADDIKRAVKTWRADHHRA